MKFILNIENYLAALPANAVYLSHCPHAPAQRGPTCGFYALSYITQFYNQVDANYPFYPAKKHDCQPSAKHSLREIGKKTGVTVIGGIFDVAYFSTILADTAYSAEIKHFTTEQAMEEILCTALKQQTPIIFPMDIKRGNSKINLKGHGQGAHYITITGAYQKNNKTYYIAYTWEKYYCIKQTDLFKSNQNLIETDNDYYLKKGDWYRSTSPDPMALGIPKISLQGLQSQCVLVQKKAHDVISGLPEYYYKTPPFKRTASDNEKVFATFIETAKTGSYSENEDFILRHPGILNIEDDLGQNGLLWAASVGNFAAVKCHLFYGANTQARSSHIGDHPGYNALHWATMRGHVEVVRLLLAANARTDRLAKQLWQPIHLAAKCGQFEILKLMLQCEPQLLDAQDRFEQTPLIWAAANGQTIIVEYLLALGANIHKSTQKSNGHDWWCALEWATNNGHHKTVSSLLTHEEKISPERMKTLQKLAKNHKPVISVLQQYKEAHINDYPVKMAMVKPLTEQLTESVNQHAAPPPSNTQQRPRKKWHMRFFICGYKSKQKNKANPVQLNMRF